MKLTDDQGKALRTIGSFMQEPTAPLLSVLTGFAGTGKTTLLKLVAQACAAQGRPFRILAPTGKAALRVKEATGYAASTIHRFLYEATEDPDTGDITFVPKTSASLLDYEGGLIIIDEASMMSKRIWTHLKAAAEVVGFQIIMVGDTFQLEPIGEESENFSALDLVTPYRAHLSEVVRQALDSPVLRAATMIRIARTPMEINMALAELTPLLDRTPIDVAFQNPEIPVIVHRNVTRHEINRGVRTRRELPSLPVAGEPLLVTKNNYAVGLIGRFNGEVLRLDTIGLPGEVPVKDRGTDQTMTLNYAQADIEGDRVILCADEIAGQTHGLISEAWVSRGAGMGWRRGVLREPPNSLIEGSMMKQRPSLLHCNYGYALSCHKAQGSEWPKILMVLEPSIALHSTSGRRWTYTALTRAKLEVLWTTL